MKDDDIPAVIPAVSFDKNGEPRIVREVLRKESPIPRSIALLLLLLSIATVVYVFTEQNKRDAEFDQQQLTDQMQFDQLEATVKRLNESDLRSERERDALRALVLGVIAADGNEDEVRRVLERFADATDAIALQSPSSTSSTAPTDDPEQPGEQPQAMPAREPSPRSTSSRPPSPEPSENPSPPPPQPTPSPTRGGPVGVFCVDSILGRICV